MDRYPATLVAVIIAVIIASLGLVLLTPFFHADAAQAAILLGVLVLVLQQLIGLRTQEANGHRLTAVEKVAATGTIQGDSNTARLDVADKLDPDPLTVVPDVAPPPG